MRFTAQASVLSQALADVRPWAVPQHSDPQRGCVRIVASVDRQMLDLTCGDMIHSITLSIPADVTMDGQVSLMAKEAASLGKVLSTGEVVVATDDKHWTKVTCGKRVLELAGLRGEDYTAPTGPGEDAEHHTIAGALLAKVLGGPLYAVSADDSQPARAQLIMEIGDAIESAATDGHTIALCSTDRPENLALRGRIQFSRAGAQRLAKIAPHHSEWSLDVGRDASTGKPALRFSAGNLVLVLGQHTMAPPPFRRVIPTTFAGEYSCSREDLVGLLDLLKLAAPPDSSAVHFEVSADSLRGKSSNRERANAHDEIPVEDFAGEEISIWLHAGWLGSMLAAIADERVRLRWNGTMHPLVVATSSDTHVVSPMTDKP